MNKKESYKAMREFMRRKNREMDEEVPDSSKNVSMNTADRKQMILKKQLHERLGLAWLKDSHVNMIYRFFIPLDQADKEGQNT